MLINQADRLRKRLRTATARNAGCAELLAAASSCSFRRLGYVIQLGLRRRMSLRAMKTYILDVTAGRKRPRGYTADDIDLASLLRRYGGRRAGEVGHRALDLPSIDVSRRRETRFRITMSHGPIRVDEVRANVAAASFESETASVEPAGELGGGAQKRQKLYTIMADETALQAAVRYEESTDRIVGVCQHPFLSEASIEAATAALTFTSVSVADAVAENLKNGVWHAASLLSVFSFAKLGRDGASFTRTLIF